MLLILKMRFDWFPIESKIRTPRVNSSKRNYSTDSINSDYGKQVINLKKKRTRISWYSHILNCLEENKLSSDGVETSLRTLHRGVPSLRRWWAAAGFHAAPAVAVQLGTVTAVTARHRTYAHVPNTLLSLHVQSRLWPSSTPRPHNPPFNLSHIHFADSSFKIYI